MEKYKIKNKKKIDQITEHCTDFSNVSVSSNISQKLCIVQFQNQNDFRKTKQKRKIIYFSVLNTLIIDIDYCIE